MEAPDNGLLTGFSVIIRVKAMVMLRFGVNVFLNAFKFFFWYCL